jgi:inosine-uridine nucleoside N-ribohydrolase
MTDAPRLTIMDVDTGIDDALALALATRSPELDLLAATTLAGNVTVERTTANTLAVLDYLGAANVPVHRGASHALSRPHHDAAHHHGESGLGTAVLPASARSASGERGPAAIIRKTAARPGELTLVCTGPMTNLAIALNVAPELPGLLRRVVVMGGAFTVGGNVTPYAEYNIYADPEAAKQVFDTLFPELIVVGLDVTRQVAIERSTWEWAERNAPDGSPARLVAEVCREAFVDHGDDELFLHDPLAAAVAFDPSLVQCEWRAIDVDCGEAERGRTRIVGQGTIQVATAVDAERFLALFQRRLGLE